MTYQDLILDFSPDIGKAGEFRVVAASSEARLYEINPQAAADGPRFRPPPRPWERADRKPGNDREARRFPELNYGSQVWEALPASIQDLIATGPKEADILRIKISGQSTVINDLPWEVLRDADNRPPFGLRSNYQIARTIPIRLPIPPRQTNRPTILIVASEPRVKAAFDFHAQVDAIAPAAQSAGFRVEVLNSAQVATLAEALKGLQPQVLHFIGHAAINRGEGCLVMENQTGSGSEWLSGASLARILPMSVGLLCLSTPFNVVNYEILGFVRLAQTRLNRQPTTVVNQFPVSRSLAIDFWKNFYPALTSNRIDGDVNQAMTAARQFVGERAGPDSLVWAAFSLVLRDDTGIPFRFHGPQNVDASRQALQIEATLRSRKANELAERLRMLGQDAPASLQREFDGMKESAKSATERLGSIPK